MQNTLVRAAATGLPSFSRRQSLLAGIGIVGAAAVPVAIWSGDASAEADPIFALIAEHRAFVDWFDSTPRNDGEADDLSRRECEMLRQLAAVPPSTPSGIAALARYMVENDNGGIWAEPPGSGSDDCLWAVAMETIAAACLRLADGGSA